MDIQSHLKQFGYFVCGKVSSGVIAIEKTEQLEPDLVINDVIMPEMNGRELAAIVRKVLDT